MTGRRALDEKAQAHGWSRDERVLFSGNVMTFYQRGQDEIRSETNNHGGLVWLARCAGGWEMEALDINNDRGLLTKALEWLSAPIEVEA